MAGSELQGVKAVGCSPFNEWCDDNDLEPRVLSVMKPNRREQEEDWNKSMKATQEAHTELGDLALRGLRQSEDEAQIDRSD